MRNSSEGSNGGKTHEDGNDSKNDSSQTVQEVDKWPAARACQRQRKAEEQRDKEHLKDVSPRERVEDRGGVDIEAATGMHQVTDNESDQKRKCRDKFEIQQSLTADTADFLHVFHARNPGDQGAEDDQRDDHGDQANKGDAEGYLER